MPEYTAIEINSPKIAEIITTLDPSLKGLDYENDLHQNFLVIGFPNEGETTLVTPETFKEHFDHIENGLHDLRIKLLQFIAK